MSETQRSSNVTTKLRRITDWAREHPERVFTSIAHFIDVEWMREAYRRTRKDAAPGVDRQSAVEFASDLDANLQGLVDGLRGGNYRPPPVRRSYVPKGNGQWRAIGVPTFADKVMQRAVAMLLEAIYEPGFHPHSYGFRPGRSAHQALKELQKRPTFWHFCWIIEADIERFFDALDPKLLRSFLDQRVRDGVVRRAIDKWLRAGVLEDGVLRCVEVGTPQGGVLSPVLANIYLHHVLDAWFDHQVCPRLRPRAQLIRYADDFVLLFGWEKDARRVYEVLPKRFARFGLTLHPAKTRLLPFTQPDWLRPGASQPGSFAFLGFTHYWGRSRKGRYVVKQKTAADRFSRTVKRVKEQCRKMMHWRLRDQHQRLCHLLRGHYNYFGITGNGDALSRLHHEVGRLWGRALARRNGRRFAWQRFQPLLQRYPLPAAHALHSVCPSEPVA